MAVNVTSLFAVLFLAIQKQIKDNVPDVKWIDQDLGQLEFYEGARPPVVMPCVLIDFNSTQYENLSQGSQWGNITVGVRLCFAPFASANSVAPDVSKEHALQYYEIENKLYKALNGFDADSAIQPLTRISAATEKREDPLRVREILFTSACQDDEDADVVNTIKAGLQIDQDID